MLATMLVGAVLSAPGFGARLDVGPHFPLSAPQNTYFTAGPGGSITGEVGILPFLDLELQLAYLLLPKTMQSPTAGDGTLFSIGAGARVRRPLEDNLVIPWGEVLLNYGFSGGSRFPLTFTAGVSFTPVRKVGFLLGPYVRLNQVFGVGAPEAGFQTVDATVLSFGISLEYLYAPAADDDNDGVEDYRDKCPGKAGTAANGGCPDETDDADNDGIMGDADKCPKAPEDHDGFQDEDGCPEPDNDHDGVLDAQDSCPIIAGPAKLHGCPDADGDGVSDRDDACPTVAGSPEERGCPKYKQLVVTENKIEIKQKIYFAFGTTKIMPKSDPLLEEVGQALKDRAKICVRIEGHTDNVGGREANQVLSQGRAEAVREFLIGQSIEPSRLRAMGYADTLPLDNNNTPEGRENNRRVEFVIVPCPTQEAQ